MEKVDTSHRFVITTVWECLNVSSESEGILGTPLPKPNKYFTKDEATAFQSTCTSVSCDKIGVHYNLVSGIKGSRLTDTLSMPSYPGPGCPDTALQLFDLALGLDARSAFAVLLASDYVCVTAALFKGRSAFYAKSRLRDRGSIVPDALFSYSHPVLYKPQQSVALPPKLSGVARDVTSSFSKAVEHVGPRGCMALPTPFSFTLGYDIGMYGRAVGPVWANFDCSFLYDYSVGSQNPVVKNILERCFSSVCSTFSGGSYLERCIATVAPIVWANYEALHFKTRLEDSFEDNSEPCAVVWNDLSVLAAFRLVDGGFIHAWFDSDMSAEATAIAGLGIAVHDLFDLGADLSCGEVANVVPTLTDGDLSLSSLAALYTRFGAILRWYGTNMPHDTAAMSILLTFWWQLGNMRHRIVQAVCVPIMSERLRIPKLASIDHRPCFEDFVVGNLQDEDAVWGPLQHRVLVPDLTNASLPCEMQALGRDFVLPYALAAMSSVPEPPADHVGTSRIMAVLSMGLTPTTRAVLWEWASYLWDSGACWSSLLGTLCYKHHGRLNDDRARATHTSEVWSG